MFATEMENLLTDFFYLHDTKNNLFIKSIPYAYLYHIYEDMTKLF